MLLEVLGRAIQTFGAAGVSQDTPLASMWTSGRAMRIVDGPDEVQPLQLGRNVSKCGPALLKRIRTQTQKTGELAAETVWAG